jgi:hypothetical protein
VVDIPSFEARDAELFETHAPGTNGNDFLSVHERAGQQGLFRPPGDSQTVAENRYRTCWKAR